MLSNTNSVSLEATNQESRSSTLGCLRIDPFDHLRNFDYKDLQGSENDIRKFSLFNLCGVLDCLIDELSSGEEGQFQCPIVHFGGFLCIVPPQIHKEQLPELQKCLMRSMALAPSPEKILYYTLLTDHSHLNLHFSIKKKCLCSRQAILTYMPDPSTSILFYPLSPASDQMLHQRTRFIFTPVLQNQGSGKDRREEGGLQTSSVGLESPHSLCPAPNTGLKKVRQQSKLLTYNEVRDQNRKLSSDQRRPKIKIAKGSESKKEEDTMSGASGAEKKMFIVLKRKAIKRERPTQDSLNDQSPLLPSPQTRKLSINSKDTFEHPKYKPSNFQIQASRVPLQARFKASIHSRGHSPALPSIPTKYKAAQQNSPGLPQSMKKRPEERKEYESDQSKKLRRNTKFRSVEITRKNYDVDEDT